MALYDPVDGVYRKVAKKYDPVDGIYRKVTKAYDPVDGVYRQYFSSDLTAGGLAVGDSIWLNVDGTLTEFLVVHQGNPDSALYDASCSGTWLLMKDIYSMVQWDCDEYDQSDELVSEMSNEYAESEMHKYYMGYYFIRRFDSNVQSAIKDVKIPYVEGAGYGSVRTGANGLSTKIFLLSGYEVGFTVSDHSALYADGACLDYFVGATRTTRTAYYNGSEHYWWLRTPQQYEYDIAFCVDTYGYLVNWSCDKERGMRPAFILDSNTPIAQADGKNIIE